MELTFFTRSEERKYKVMYFDEYCVIGAWPFRDHWIVRMGGAGDWEIGCQWLAGLVSGGCL